MFRKHISDDPAELEKWKIWKLTGEVYSSAGEFFNYDRKRDKNIVHLSPHHSHLLVWIFFFNFSTEI